jgi:hypothetical protein
MEGGRGEDAAAAAAISGVEFNWDWPSTKLPLCMNAYLAYCMCYVCVST